MQLLIWDTGGQERYRAITSSFYRRADAIVLVYDIGSAESFGNLQKWLQEAREYTENVVVYMLVGNKSDQIGRRDITSEQGEQKARGLAMPFMETSAKDSHNLDELFMRLGETLLDKKLTSEPASPDPNTISLNKGKESEKRGCSCC